MNPAPPRRSRFVRLLRLLATYGLIVLGTLLVLDLALRLIGFRLPDPEFGDADLGWRPAPVTRVPQFGRCTEFSTGQQITYQRNEDGIRTWLPRGAPTSDSAALRIAVTGDSHTELCATNPNTHFGMMEKGLRTMGVPAVVLAYGVGRYSPLQDYLAYRTVLRPYGPRVLVMNVYTGNDFADLLRIDDRPHFVKSDSGYRIAPPTWYVLADPHHPPSRDPVLALFRTLFDRIGLRRAYLRFSDLRQLASSQGEGPWTVFHYMRDLLRAREPLVGYSDAFSAQFLNQQLFFHYFPNAREESLRRMRELLRRARAENPGVILVMSPIPSYQLVDRAPIDSTLQRTLRRLPLSLESGIREEGGLYEGLRGLAAQEGWLFVDNLAALRTYHGTDRLYNDFDYHVLPIASALIAQGEVEALLPLLKTR